MKKKVIIPCLALTALLALGSCGSSQKTVTTTTTTTPTVQTSGTGEVTADPQASPDFITVKEAADVLLHPEKLAAVAKKYGYRTIDNYNIHLLDKYQKMLYKNCTPARKLPSGSYMDTPQPRRRGISSYVALNQQVTIGVFNAKAYENLVNQVKQGGFQLVDKGYEDVYSNGNLEAYCYPTRKTVRIKEVAPSRP